MSNETLFDGTALNDFFYMDLSLLVILCFLLSTNLISLPDPLEGEKPKKEFFTDDNSYYPPNKETFSNCIANAVDSVFGEFGSSVPKNLINYNCETGKGVLRCPARFYVKLRAALTLYGEHEGKKCVFTVNKASSNLLSLIANSRTFVHELHT